jgi:hypothetical protein
MALPSTMYGFNLPPTASVSLTGGGYHRLGLTHPGYVTAARRTFSWGGVGRSQKDEGAATSGAAVTAGLALMVRV